MEPTPATPAAQAAASFNAARATAATFGPALAALSSGLKELSKASDAFARAWWRARPDETTAEAAERGRAAEVAAWVGHPVQRLN